LVPEGQHDRSLARSAWTWNHEEKSLVPAGRLNGSRLRFDAKQTFQQEYLELLKRHELRFDDKISETDNDFGRPSGTGPLYIATQALRTWLLSACPSGTKASIEATHIYLSAYGLKPRAEWREVKECLGRFVALKAKGFAPSPGGTVRS
jgi:hypothetical protein